MILKKYYVRWFGLNCCGSIAHCNRFTYRYAIWLFCWILESGLSSGAASKRPTSHSGRLLGEQARDLMDQYDRGLALRRATQASEILLSRNTIMKVLSILCIR